MRPAPTVLTGGPDPAPTGGSSTAFPLWSSTFLLEKWGRTRPSVRFMDARRGSSAMATEWCRVWWPRGRLQPEPLPSPERLVLFGWLFVRTGSVDAVVAAALPQEEILRSFPTPEALQCFLSCWTVILSSNTRMPARLQECAAFTILGDCVNLPREFEVCCSKQNHQPLGTQSVQKGYFDMTQNSPVVSSGSLESGDQDQNGYSSKWEYDCSILDGFLGACKKSVVKERNWVHLCYKSSKSLKCNLNQVPVHHYLCLDDQKFETSHCHVCHTI